MSHRNPLLVVSVDAMHVTDIPFAHTLPAFGRILATASVAEIEGIFPSLTYPNHIAQVTGCPPARSGIWNNLQFQPGRGPATEWLHDASMIRAPHLLEVAKAAGLSTASVQWPVSANAGYVDYLMPELVCPSFEAEGYASAFRRTTNEYSYTRYLEPNLGLIRETKDGQFFDLVNHVVPEILRHEKPDVMLAHFVEVDTARHKGGAEGPHVEEALRIVDRTLGHMLRALEDTGRSESTNIVLVSDHGHLDIDQHTCLNVLFRDRGLLRTDDDGTLIDYDVFLHSSGLSGQIFLAEGLPDERLAEVESLLDEILATPEYRIVRIMSSSESEREYGLGGPFTWVVESEPGVALSSAWTGSRVVQRRGEPDFPAYASSHGHEPRHGGQPVLIATGPDIVPGLDLGRRTMLDEAPTLAALLGVELRQAEGEAMTELLRTASVAASSR